MHLPIKGMEDDVRPWNSVPMPHASLPFVIISGRKKSGHSNVVKLASLIIYHKREMLCGTENENSISFNDG